jgi:hypothetical protein
MKEKREQRKGRKNGRGFKERGRKIQNSKDGDRNIIFSPQIHIFRTPER